MQRNAGRVALNRPPVSEKSAAARRKPVTRGLVALVVALSPFALTVAACGGSDSGSGVDSNNDKLADALGRWLDANNDGAPDQIDINKDGKPDGYGVDTNKDGILDALALDTDCDGIYDSIDNTGDLKADGMFAGFVPKVPGCPVAQGGNSAGGASPMGGSAGAVTAGAGGKPGSAGSSGAGTAGGSGSGSGSQLGVAQYQGSGTSSFQYQEDDIYRNGVGYKFLANGWGKKWSGHTISWKGTSFTVESLTGAQGDDYSPAGYPTMFCGLYSEPQKMSAGACGLPATIASLKSVKTGWRWKANASPGQYNAAWDIWLGNGNSLSSYLMVWLRDPPGQQPAGKGALSGATVTGLPGTWTVWVGSVNGHPIVNYIQPEGQDLGELEFDVLDVYRDAMKRGYTLPGSQILAVAIGFEIWNGPVTNLATSDFYVDVK